MYKILRVDLADYSVVERVKELHKECFPVDKVLEPEFGYWWAVWYKGDIVGFCALRQSARWSDCGYLWRSGVVPDHRGRGLQRRMITTREKLARKLGWSYMISDTNQNPQSANNLIRCGYSMYDPSWPYGIDSTCYWRKKL